jgi:hypothetical protein
MTDRCTAAWLFAGLTLLYVAATGGHVYEPDGLVMARATEALAERGTLAIDDPGYPPGFLAPGTDGLAYSKYGIGFSLWSVPFHLAGTALETVAPPRSEAVFGARFLWYSPDDRDDAFAFLGVALANAPLVAGACALLYLLALELCLGPRLALGAALLAGLASPMLVYAKTSFAEPLAACGVTGTALALARWQRTMSGGAALAAGAGLAVAVLAKPAMLVLVPVAACAAAVAAVGRILPADFTLRSMLTALAIGALPVAAVGAALATLNARLFGSAFATGYDAELGRFSSPWGPGLAGLLVSPGRGLLVYFPAVVLALAGSAALWKHTRWAVLWTWGAFAALLLVHAGWYGWDGGWCWGPRFLVPALPLLALLAAAGVAAAPLRSAARWGGWLLVAASAALSWTGTLVPTTEYHHGLRLVVGPQAYLDMARWSWSVLPPRLYWGLPKTYWLLPRALALPEARWLGVALAACLALALVALGRAVRLAWRSAPAAGAEVVTPSPA